MANIKFNRKKFEKEIGKLNKEMKNKIGMFGTTLESLTDEEIELEIFPDRPDLLSYEGFKRAFLAFLGKKTGLIKYHLNKPKKDYLVKVDSSVNKIRPITVCAVVKGLKLDDKKIKELVDIQEKLHSTIGRKRKKAAMGIYPLKEIKFPITYRALEPDKIKFQPLESSREMSGLEILRKHPTGKEYAHLLTGKTKFPIFVDSDEKILSMPPIINSQSTGRINEKTKGVFIECSGFDKKILKKCLNILVSTMAEMGGKIYQIKVDKETTPKLLTEKRKISLEKTNKLLGLELNEKELKNCLEKMGHNYSKGKVEIPPWRTDILHEVDLIEDVAIAYGYDNFEPSLPNISNIGEESEKERGKRKIADILCGLDFLEISNFHLTTKKDQITNMKVLDKQENNYPKVKGSKTDYNLLRMDLTHYLLKTISRNVDSEYPQRIFEVGRVFEKEDNNLKEKEKLGVAITPGSFTELKQTLNYLFDMLGIKAEFKNPSREFPNWFIDGRVAEIYSNNKKIGYLGEVHPKVLYKWKIKMPIALFEIDLEKTI